MGVRQALERANRTTRPEDSVALRVRTLLAVLVGVGAVGVTQTASLPDVVAAALLLPVGAAVSHRRREEANFLLKAALAIAAVLALVRFFGDLQLAGTIDDTRLPLADLFLAVIVIHSFDTPQRRDLGFAIASSVALVALAGVEARSGWFVLVVAAFAAAVAAASVAMQRSAAKEAADVLADGDRLARLEPSAAPAVEAHTTRADPVRRSWRAVVLPAAGLALLVLGAFLFLPRTGSFRVGGIPFSGFGGAPVAGAGVINAGLPYGGSRPAGDLPFNPDAYAGFAEVVDLRVRGELSDDLVLRVRTDRPRLLRGLVFDVYDGQTWRRSAPEPELAEGIPARVSSRGGSVGSWSETITQTIELHADTPNLLFAAAEPVDVYHAAGAVWVWDDGTLTTGAEQEAGVVYSVVSRHDLLDREALLDDVWSDPGALDEEFLARWLQLPDELPQRVHDLAASITADAPSTYAKAIAIQDWLGANVEYALDTAPQPRGTDTVDWFLFDHRVGWCEPIASSMVVLLRSAGVPARLATGFLPGPRNPLTGWYDIRMSDAHAWVELWEPSHGIWLAMDPTGAVPAAALGPGTTGSRIVAVDLVRWLGARVLPAVRDAVPAGVAAAVVALAGLAGGAVALRRRRLRPPVPAFARLERALGRRGVARGRAQTPREYVAEIRSARPDIPGAALARLLEAEERRLYADLEADPVQPEHVDEDLRSVLRSL